jgi:Mg-chelatase subunit ChlD
LRAHARQGWSGTREIGQIIRSFKATFAFDQGLAQQLANHLKAPCYALSELKAESLYHAVKDEMAKPMKK